MWKILVELDKGQAEIELHAPVNSEWSNGILTSRGVYFSSQSMM